MHDDSDNILREMVVNYFHAAAENKVAGRPMPLGVLSEEGRTYLENLSGIHMKEIVEFVLNPSDCKHAYQGHFGDNEKDKGNNIPLTDTDLWKFVDVLSSPDEIIFGIDKRTDHKLYFFLKKNDVGTYNLAEVYGDKKGNLTAKSLYNTRKGISRRVNELLKSSNLTTSKTSGASLSTAKIPHLFELYKLSDKKILGKDISSEHFQSINGLYTYISHLGNSKILDENRSRQERAINKQISTTMSKTKKQPVKQVKAAQGKQDAEPVEKTANESVKNEESKAEKQHRPPQMVTVNGQKVTHAHAFRSNTNPEDMWFTAKIDGKDLKARKMSAEDVKAYHDKTITVEQLMQKYYPTKLLPKVSKEDFKAANVLSDGRTIEKFTVYKEDNEKSRDYGKYRMYAKVGNRQYRKTLSQADLDRFYDHVTTPKELVESNLGEVLNLASAYEKYKLPEGEKVENINVRKNAEGKWLISANLGVKGQTAEHELNQSDLYSLFNAKTASKEQLAAKYLTSDIKNAKAQTEQQKQSKSNSMKI